MARAKKNNRRNTCGWDGEVYWGSDGYNRRLYNSYLHQMIQLALTRYEWHGLPPTVDPIWLERTLLFEGQATIAYPTRGRERGLWYAAKVASDGPLNMYDRPTKWTAYSRDRLRFSVTAKNGIVIYDNVDRYPVYDVLDLAARELVDIQKTKQVNRFQQKVPFILVTPPDMELTAVNLMSSIMGGEPATIANPSIRDIDAYKLDMQTPYIGAELTAAEQNVWNRVYTALGIANVTFKSERMIEDEVRNMSEPANMFALAGLIERRRGAEILERYHGLEGVTCVWRQDNESDNYNTLGNLRESAKLLAGDTKGLGEVF